MKFPHCDCQHADSLTCSATLHTTTRFNTLISYGQCMCQCHRAVVSRWAVQAGIHAVVEGKEVRGRKKRVSA